ncbi:MAG: hypothetical protein IT158_10360 [Bryobacterales bacterium]|nr:hypothetical protein [Bryobacterales bacterium]
MRVFFLALALAGAALGQTVIAVHNAATLSSGIPAAAVAPGSIIAIQIVRGGPVPVGIDPSRLAVSVRPVSGSAEIAAPVLRTGVGAILALLPKQVPAGEAEVMLAIDGQPAAPARIWVQPVAAGLFITTQAPPGMAIAQNVRPDLTLELNALLTPALPGDYVILWGTGLGDTPAGDVMVEIGGVPVAPAYAGPAPGLPGVDQINVAIPSGIPEGCYVSVLLRTPASISNEAVLSLASARGPCVHPLGLTEAQLRELEAGRSVRIIQAFLRSEIMRPAGPPADPPVYTRNGAASVEFALRNASDVLLFSQPLLRDEAYFSCRLVNPVAVPRFTFVDPFDAGPTVNISGPGGKSLEARNEGVPILYVSFLEAPEPKPDPRDLPPPFFTEGAWVFSGPGGKDAAPFHAELELPPPIRLDNRDELRTLERSRDAVISWQADGYTGRDVLTVILTSRFFPQPPPAGVRANGILCRVAAGAGQLTIPSALLRQIPATPGISALAGTLDLRLASHPYRRKIVDLPLAGGRTEKMVLDYLHSESLSVAIR